jgi:hypothetical protein
MTTNIDYRRTVTSADAYTRSICQDILDTPGTDADARAYAEYILTLPIKLDGKRAAEITTARTSGRVSGRSTATNTSKPANPADLISATEKQINALINMGSKKLIGDAVVRHLTVDLKVQDIVDRATAGKLVTKGEASKALDFLFPAPWKPREAAPKTAQKAPAGATEDGMYKLGNRIVKVQKAVHGSGNLYAKELLGSKEEGFYFEYAPGLINKLTADDKLSLEEAKAFGALYGTCCCCGRTLTREVSIAAGIGPDCAKKF